jgi:hypothetical protein
MSRMPVEEVLVSVKHKDGTAAVMVDDEGAWLSGYAEKGPSTSIDGYQMAREGLRRRRTVYGGLAPPGAAAVTLLDAAGGEHPASVANGAWVRVVHDRERLDACLVRFTDARGELVAPPLPPEWPREPVDDATVDCPLCHSRAWDVVTAIDGSRGTTRIDGEDEKPGRVVVCRRCGHEVQVGALIRVSWGDDEPELSDAAAALEMWATP